IGLGPGRAQLVQRVRSERAEGKESRGPQDPADLGKHGIDRLTPLQHEIAVNDIHAGIREWQPHRIAAHAFEPAEEPLAPACLTQHPRCEVDSNDECVTVAALEFLARPAWTRAQIENGLRLKAEQLEAAEQLIADLLLQCRAGVVSGAGTIESRANPRSVEAELIGAHRRRILARLLRRRL